MDATNCSSIYSYYTLNGKHRVSYLFENSKLSEMATRNQLVIFFVVFARKIRLRVVHLLRSLTCMTRKKAARKKMAARIFFLAVIFRVMRDGLS